MKSFYIHSDSRQFFCFTGLFFLGLVLTSSILAILGIFYIGIICLYITIGLAFLTHCFLKNELHLNLKSELAAVFFVSAFFAAVLSIFTVPTIFSGRDQGSYSEAAIRLSQNHKLEFSTPASEEFFKIYGPGKALNFPGFSYEKDGDLTSSFPAGYISWLAVFYSFFGLSGLIIANAFSFFVFLLSFYLLARIYLEKIPALIAFLLILTSFIFSWFFKFTLSENLALGIIFFGLHQLALYSKNYQKINLFSSFLSFAVLLFVKIEAFAFLVMLFLVIYLLAKKNGAIISPSKNKKAVAFFAIILFFYLWNVFSGGAYYKTIGKAFFHAISGQGAKIVSSSNLFFESFYTLEILSIYSVLIFIILGICGFTRLLIGKKYFKIIPFLILLPSFFYLLQPSISDDHPWMLRRFAFSVVPICILYAVIFLDTLFKKRCLFYSLSFLILLSNLAISVPYLKASENEGMLSEIEVLSRNFRDTDLVLVDQKATGDGFAMMTGPLNFLYKKQAVYFINPDDVNRIDSAKFGHIYFIIPNNNLDLYRKSGLMERLAPVKDYSISTTRLDIQTDKNNGLISQPIELPIEKDATVSGKIYLLK